MTQSEFDSSMCMLRMNEDQEKEPLQEALFILIENKQQREVDYSNCKQEGIILSMTINQLRMQRTGVRGEDIDIDNQIDELQVKKALNEVNRYEIFVGIKRVSAQIANNMLLQKKIGRTYMQKRIELLKEYRNSDDATRL